jgi:DNA polymerase-1
MTTTRGEPTGGLYGFSSLLCKLLREEQPLGVAVAVDAPGPTVRHAAYAAYKAGRQVAPDPLRTQLAQLPELVRAMGVPLHRVPGQEADDVLATLAARIEGPVLVVSGDTDLTQLVDERVTHLFVGRRQKEHVRYDPAAARERWGFEPRFLPTYKAMAGDPSDNLPGIDGIGATTARRLCAEHGDAAGILAALDAGRIGNPRVRPVLAAAREDLVRWEGLGRLRADLPLAEPLWAPVDRDGLRAFFERFEFKSLLGRL